MDNIEKARLEQLERCIPVVWDFNEYLYIGAGSYRHHFFERMQEKKIVVDIIEIDYKNCQWINKNHKWVRNIYYEDVREHFYNEGDLFNWWSIIIWSHGIETISKNNFAEDLIIRLEEAARKIVIHMTPFGSAGGTGNVSAWYPGDFERLGYKTDTLGKENERNSNLLAWKYL